MRYNLHKIMVIWIGGEVVGCVRVAQPAYRPGPQQLAYLVLFLNPMYGKDDEILKIVFTEIWHIKDHVRRNGHFRWAVMSKYMPPLKDIGYGFSVSTSQQFGGTRRKRSATVLYDEEMDGPSERPQNPFLGLLPGEGI